MNSCSALAAFSVAMDMHPVAASVALFLALLWSITVIGLFAFAGYAYWRQPVIERIDEYRMGDLVHIRTHRHAGVAAKPPEKTKEARDLELLRKYMPEVKPHEFRGLYNTSVCGVCGLYNDHAVHTTKRTHKFMFQFNALVCAQCGEPEDAEVHEG